MAVIIKEEKKQINWTLIIFVGLILVLIFGVGYYFFFKKPELIDVVAPMRLEPINKISKIQFDPASVIDSPNFKILRDYSTPLILPEAGRENPFHPLY